MRIRGLYIALLVLGLLTGLLYWSNHHKPADDSVKASADTPPKILSINEADLIKVDLHRKEGEQVALVRGATGSWEIVAPRPLTADQSAVASMLGTVSTLNAERVVDEKATNLGQYGLQAPVLQLDLTSKNNKSQKLLMGDNTPTGSAVYAMVAGDPRVFTVASYTKSGIDKTANDLRDKRLLTLEPDKISRIELKQKNQDLEFGRNKEEWQIVKPEPLRADSSQVADLLSKLTQARMEAGSEDQKAAASAFASGAPVGKFQITGESGAQQLDVRKNKNDYYAKSSVVAGIYKVSSEIGQAFDKKLDDFRNKKLFDFGFDDPDKVEVRDGSKIYGFGRKGDDWLSSEGKKLDSSGVQQLLGNLRSLRATKFAVSGFANPEMEVTVTSGEGKRVERVQIAPSGKSYIGKRENDSTLYELDSSAVADLQKSAAAVKSAETSKK